jgi:hypothetical protein
MFYTVQDVGETRSLTGEGFMLCRDVPVARTGVQHYHAAELAGSGLNFDASQPVAIERHAEDVFADAALRSLAGKPVTIEHPVTEVGPYNWHELSVGSVNNVRADRSRGVVLADLLITARRGIDAIRNGLRAVSVGYTADYAPIGRNRARQRNIICNHLSLCDQGRCGALCQVGDAAYGRRHHMKQTRDQDPLERLGGGGPHGSNQTEATVLQTGTDWVMDLPGDQSAYFIGINPKSQKAALYYFAHPEASLGKTATGSRMVADVTIATPQQRAGARWADAERQRQSVLLTEWNRKNNEAWSERLRRAR